MQNEIRKSLQHSYLLNAFQGFSVDIGIVGEQRLHSWFQPTSPWHCLRENQSFDVVILWLVLTDIVFMCFSQRGVDYSNEFLSSERASIAIQRMQNAASADQCLQSIDRHVIKVHHIQRLQRRCTKPSNRLNPFVSDKVAGSYP